MKIGYFPSSEEFGPADPARREPPVRGFVQQVGGDDVAFFEAYREHVLPRFS